MEKMLLIFTNINFYISIAIIVFMFLLYIIIKNIMIKLIKKNNKHSKKKETYIKLFKNIIKYVFIIVTILLVLQINGVNVSSLFVGLGATSLVVGLALQDALKDIISGFNILTDNYFCVGDDVNIDGFEGTVTEIGLKVTKLKSLIGNNTIVIANRNINKVINFSNELNIDIPSPYEKNSESIEKVIDKIIDEINRLEGIEKVEYLGISELANSSVNYRIHIICSADKKGVIKRASLKIIKYLYDKNNISIPYQKIDIHNI